MGLRVEGTLATVRKARPLEWQELEAEEFFQALGWRGGRRKVVCGSQVHCGRVECGAERNLRPTPPSPQRWGSWGPGWTRSFPKDPRKVVARPWDPYPLLGPCVPRTTWGSTSGGWCWGRDV